MYRFYNRLLISLMTLVSMASWADNSEEPLPYERRDSEHIEEIMTAWSESEGPWLYESMASLVMKSEHPERPSRVSNTTFELLQQMDDQRRERIERAANRELENERNSTRSEAHYWEEWLRLFESAECARSESSSNGDPHMKTYDGEKYDFQTAGDYMLTSSDDERFMIQTQQVRHNDQVSVNGAAYLNVNGDEIELYAQNHPDPFKDKVMRINGETVENEKAEIILKNGGVIRYENGRNVVNWPTGEQVQFQTRTFQDSKLLDLFVNVPECNDNYRGLLGDNNGDGDDDFDVDEPSDREATRVDYDRSFDALFGAERNAPQQRKNQQKDLEFLSRTFGDQYALDEATSRFTNPMVNLTEEERYPQSHATLADMEDEKLDEAIKVARDAGVPEDRMYAAVYDYGFVGLEPIADFPVYNRPEKREERDEPKIEKDREEKKDNIDIIPQIRMGTGVFRGVQRGNTRRAPTQNKRRQPTRTNTERNNRR
ncbi:MAG: VWD domain-containing protein [Bacteroidota bacterium]